MALQPRRSTRTSSPLLTKMSLALRKFGVLYLATIVTRSEVAHPQEDDNADFPLQDLGQLRGSVLGEERDFGQKAAEGSRISGLRRVSLHHQVRIGHYLRDGHGDSHLRSGRQGIGLRQGCVRVSTFSENIVPFLATSLCQVVKQGTFTILLFSVVYTSLLLKSYKISHKIVTF
ncbi:uncharacterized protein LOC110832895 [Zootermopsis nevadensis]|uniref:uncharacterized protein LOC110832894 n=1 Tax=Zootermopsis nevadensis TaxID=136037 RepID=UPI000B8E21E6|nr:uncharacterized protein LOC110832894 [Zootermopsis nevadensis]XP_021926035.1 uncharacterized protein LOC110832895 [Zootermopsis nevadensis]